MNKISEQLHVHLDGRGYDIKIGQGIIDELASHCQDLFGKKQYFIVTDTDVATHYLPRVEASFGAANLTYHTHVVPAGEQAKSFSELEALLGDILSHRPDRHSVLVALGGGVVGDLTGFAASMLLRGVPFIQVPTTLLSQVDSSVGGKTAINHPKGKNLIGSFYQPSLVLSDIGALASLPRRHQLAGYAEIVKYGLIADAEFFEWLDQLDSELEGDHLVKAVKRSCEIKAQIVEQDETEKGIRAHLNLGHTFGHALERVTGYSDVLLHGEGVAIGMVLAARLSGELGLLSKQDVDRIASHMTKVGLPSRICDISWDWDVDAIVDAMAHDKKTVSGQLVFIVLDAIGQALIRKDVDVSLVRHIVKQDM